MKGKVYYTTLIFSVIAFLIVFSAFLTYNSNVDAKGGSEQVNRFEEAKKNNKAILVGFYSPT